MKTIKSQDTGEIISQECPQCRQMVGKEPMVHYHKMDCGQRGYIHKGNQWTETISP